MSKPKVASRLMLVVIFISVLFTPAFSAIALGQDAPAAGEGGQEQLESQFEEGLNEAKSTFFAALKGERLSLIHI